MTVTVAEVLNRANRILFDKTKIRWPDEELLDYVNDAQRQIVMYRPDANSVTGNVTMATDSRQTIPAGGMRFLRAVRNMGTGATPGRAVREASRLTLDAELPDWHTRSAAAVEHYIFDNQSPRTFYVYPRPVSANLTLEIVYSAVPANCTLNGVLQLGSQYINAVLDWVLYRCFLKDSTYAGNPQRAQMHLQSFMTDLGINMKAEFTAAVSRGDPPTHTNMQSVNDRGAG
jgi:hypothetical protein